MKCPAMGDNEGWNNYYIYQWDKIAADNTKPEYLREIAKSFLLIM